MTRGRRGTGLSGLADTGYRFTSHGTSVYGSLSTTRRYLHPDASTIAAGDSLSAFLRAPQSPGGPQLRALPTAGAEGPDRRKAR